MTGRLKMASTISHSVVSPTLCASLPEITNKINDIRSLNTKTLYKAFKFVSKPTKFNNLIHQHRKQNQSMGNTNISHSQPLQSSSFKAYAKERECVCMRVSLGGGGSAQIRMHQPGHQDGQPWQQSKHTGQASEKALQPIERCHKNGNLQMLKQTTRTTSDHSYPSQTMIINSITASVFIIVTMLVCYLLMLLLQKERNVRTEEHWRRPFDNSEIIGFSWLDWPNHLITKEKGPMTTTTLKASPSLILKLMNPSPNFFPSCSVKIPLIFGGVLSLK